MTYPDGEVASQTYTASMQPYSLAGSHSGALVFSATYNALGANTLLSLGSQHSQRRYYFGSNLDTPAWGNGMVGRLRQICVLLTAWGGCEDDNRAGSTPDKLNLAWRIGLTGWATRPRWPTARGARRTPTATTRSTGRPRPRAC